MLNLMEHYDSLIEEGRTVLNTHRYIEAMKCERLSFCSIVHSILTSYWISWICGAVSLRRFYEYVLDLNFRLVRKFATPTLPAIFHA